MPPLDPKRPQRHPPRLQTDKSLRLRPRSFLVRLNTLSLIIMEVESMAKYLKGNDPSGDTPMLKTSMFMGGRVVFLFFFF